MKRLTAHRSPRILIAIDMLNLYTPSFLQGVFAYCAAHDPWDVEVIRSVTELSPDRIRTAFENHIDGIILAMSSPNLPAYKDIIGTNIPYVTFGVYPAELGQRNRKVSHVVYDNIQLGRLGATHFLDTARYRTYAYVGSAVSSQDWSLDRMNGFCEQVRRRGSVPQVFTCRTAADWSLRHQQLKQWMRAQAKPLALLASDDVIASQVLLMCREARLRVPEDVSVLGIGDSVFCEGTNPPLSSISAPCAPGGLLAAKELARLMRSRDTCARGKTIIAPPQSDVIARASTIRQSPSRALVRRAIAFIRQNANRHLTPGDVQEHLRCSRALMDLRFRENMNQSVAEAIASARLDVLCKTLKKSGETIESIVQRLGWQNANYLKTLFKRRFGMTMREYRKRTCDDISV